MATVLKRAILRSLEQHGYALLKKAEYDGIVAAARAKPLAETQQAPPATIATSIPIEIKFEGDDGTLEYAKVGGIYVDGNQAPVFEDRLVSPMVGNPPGTTVILTFGQSNAANSCEERYTPRGTVHVFHAFDMKFYRAIDPLAGASDEGGSVWGRLGDRLIDAGFARSVLFVPIAFGATYVEDWIPGRQYYRRLLFALHRVKRAGIAVDMLCWHQGEANANHTPMTADEYHDCFRAMLRGVREAGVKAPVYVALATLCEDGPHPFQNSAQIRLGQKKVVSLWNRVMPGPDTDQIGIADRRDGCHFAASGQELAAQAWFRAITASPLEKLVLWSKYRFESMSAAKAPGAATRPIERAKMMTRLKRAILRFLEQRGYVLLTKSEYHRMLAASPPPAGASSVPPAAAAPLPVASPAMATTRATTESPPAPVVPPVSPSPLPPSPVREFATDSDPGPEFERACRRLQGKLTLPMSQAVAIYCAVRHLIRARIPGDIVDCGEGVPEALAVIGACLVALGETSRRLVLFDITSDFRHRPETSVPLWGTDYDLLAGRRPRPQPEKRVLPDVLVASGYPAERIFVARYPVDVIDLARPVAFLGLTAETYEANRAAIRTLAPRVSIGGVIAVEGNEHTPRAAVPGCVQHHLDAVAEFLNAHRTKLPFWQATGEYRLGVKSQPFGQQG
jgi:Carbohydrate esterase, sialic acid-specific acetylesterase